LIDRGIILIIVKYTAMAGIFKIIFVEVEMNSWGTFEKSGNLDLRFVRIMEI
jgi:hypothetical protein